MTTQTSRLTLSSFSAKLLSSTALTAASLAALAIPANAQSVADNALPQGEIVTHGSATYDRATENVLNIHQHSGVVSADYMGGFNIGKNAAVLMHQKSSDKFVHIDKSDKVSIINGLFSGNGTNFILNKDGVLIGENATIDMGGFVAATGELGAGTNLDAGKIEISNFGAGAIDIKGGAQITVAEAGLAAFVSPTIRNAGVINAKLGKVAFAAGEKVTLDLYGDNLVEIAVDGKLADALIEHTGEIRAEGGTVQMTASAAKEAVDNIINVKGLVTVASATQQGGKIVLSGGDQGGVSVSGKLDASGATGGGDITITGENVLATTDADLDASAIQNGDGGDIKIWGNRNSLYFGRAASRGGSQSGNGGFVEVSAGDSVGYAGHVDTTAANGDTGRFLIDPEHVVLGTIDPSIMLANIGLDVLFGGAFPVLIVDQKALANTLHTTDVDLWATGSISTAEDIDVSAYNYSTTTPGYLDTTGPIWTWHWVPAVTTNHNGITANNLTLAAPTVNILHDITLGQGGLFVQDLAAGTSPLGLGFLPAPTDIVVNELNLDGKIYTRSTLAEMSFATLASDAQLFTTADTVNILSSNALIQQGIHFAESGATVNVAEGTYQEQLSVDKDLTLQGAGSSKTIITAPGTMTVSYTQDGRDVYAVVHAHDAQVNIDGFQIDGSTNTGNSYNDNKRFVGVAYQNADGDFTNNLVRDIVTGGNTARSGFAFLASDKSGPGSTVNLIGNVFESFQKYGLALADNVTVTLTDNVITGDKDIITVSQSGIYVTSGAKVTATGNQISETDIGVEINGAAGGRYENNTLSGVHNGFAVTNGGNTKLVNNTIGGNSITGVSFVNSNGSSVVGGLIDKFTNGIVVDNSDNVTIDGVTLTNIGDTNIAVKNSDNAAIRKNDITGGKTGIALNNVTNSTVGGADASFANIIKNIASGWGNSGINIKGGSNLTISHNQLTNIGGNAIYAENGWGTPVTTLDIADNTITNVQHNGISLKHWNGADIEGNTVTGSTSGSGILLELSTGTDVLNNTVTGVVGAGVNLRYGNKSTTIQGNTLTNNKYGVQLATTSGQSNTGTMIGSFDSDPLKANIITGGVTGILVNGGGNLWIQGNDIKDASDAGISVTDSGEAYNIVNHNKINNVKDGIRLSGTTGTIADNRIGLVSGLTGSGIIVSGGNNTQILANQIGNAGVDGIQLSGSDNAKISQNQIDNAADDGIEIIGSSNVIVGGTKLSHANIVTGSGHDGITTEGGDNVDILFNKVHDTKGASAIALHQTTGSTVQGNVLTQTALLGIFAQDADGIEIIGNEIANAGYNAPAGHAHGNGIGVESTDGVTITGNVLDTIKSNGISVGVAINNADGTSSNVIVDDNKVTNAGASGILVGSGGVSVSGNTVTNVNAYGIDVRKSAGVDVNDNTVTGFRNSGIRLADSDDADIFGNTVSNAGTVRAGTGTGIEVSGSSNVEIGADDVTFISGYNKTKFLWTWIYTPIYATDNNGNHIDDTANGIVVGGGDQNKVVNNTVDEIDFGIVLGGTTNATVRDNALNGNSVTGIEIVYGSHGANVHDNTINHFTTGILVDSSSDVRLDNNTLTDVRDGIVATAANGLVITRNDLTGRTNEGTGITVSNSDNVKIGDYSILGPVLGTTALIDKGNDIRGFRNGIDADDVTGLVIVLNDIDGDGAGTGIKVTDSDGARIGGGVPGSFLWIPGVHSLGNSVEDFGTGIHALRSEDVKVEYNSVDDITGDGILVVRSQRAHIFRNDVTDVGGDGIDVERSADARILQNLVDGTGANGIEVSDSNRAEIGDNDVYGAGDDGINVDDSRRANIYGNYIDWAFNDGIDVDNSDRAQIVDNHIHGTQNGNGIELTDSDDAQIRQNYVHDTAENGIYVDNSDAARIIENDIYDAFLDGISVSDSDNARINRNNVHRSGHDGIDVDDSDYVTIERNLVDGAGENGIEVTDSFSADINGNRVRNAAENGIYANDIDFGNVSNNRVRDTGENGIEVRNSRFVDVNDNIVRRTGEDGIQVVNSFAADITGNTVRRAGDDGIDVRDSREAQVNGNTVFRTGDDGIQLLRSRDAEVIGNTITRAGDDGIDVEDSRGVAVNGNTITTTGGNGIEVEHSDYADIVGNNVNYAGFNGIYVNPSSFVDVIGNNVNFAAADGIQVNGGTNNKAFANTVLGSGVNGIVFNGSDIFQISFNTANNNAQTGILVNGSSFGEVGANTTNLNGNNGIEIRDADTVVVNNNTALNNAAGLRVSNARNLIVSGNGFGFNSQYGLFAQGPDNGLITLYNNVINASPVGARFESGVINIAELFMPNMIVGTGGTVGLQFDEVGAPGSLSLFGNTIGATTFTGFLPVGSFYVRFEDGALLDPATGAPIIIDGLNANFDGLIPAAQGGYLTAAQLAFLEDRIHDADDVLVNGRGQLFVGRVPAANGNFGARGLENQEDFFSRYGTPEFDGSGFSVTVRGLPNVTAAGLNALTPAAGDQGPASLANIEPAAGEEEGETAPQDVEPASGEEQNVSCWSDAVSSGGTATFNFGGSFEDSVAGATNCSNGDI